MNGDEGARAAARGAAAVAEWWPGQPDLRPLGRNGPLIDPMGPGFDYAREFATLDLAAVRADIGRVMTDSQEWWPADYGHYGPLFVRMAWHSAGTYRVHDGRGGAASGTQRFAPLNSWPDNANLDKARRLLWPVKRKYGRRLSWADLIVLAGNCALEAMGLRTVGFGGGRVDVWEPEQDLDWGPERTWLGDARHTGSGGLAPPYGATQMGLIYVNPEGPGGRPDPAAAARDIRETFARMGMNDEETVALIAGGHTFGKTHGAADAARHVGPEPEAAPLEAQGLGWRNSFGRGAAGDAITSGLEGSWTDAPTRWDNGFFDNLFGHEWELERSPGGAWQWRPRDRSADGTVPDAHDPARRHAPRMLTTDLALRVDPDYLPIARRYHEHPDEFARAFALAWFKLTHRDMGPVARYLGPEVPREQRIWQDPLPPPAHPPLDEAAIAELARGVQASGLSVSQLVAAAWASASTFRTSDRRGGANGARVRLAPQRDWEGNDPARLAATLAALEGVRARFAAAGGHVSLADLIVLGGGAAIEQAAARAGHRVRVPFSPGRVDAGPEHTDPASFGVLEPVADGFRNYLRGPGGRRAADLLIDRACLLGLTAPETTVLLGGLRVLGANTGQVPHGVLTERPGVLSNDFFVHLLDMDTVWTPAGPLYEGRDRRTGRLRWTATSVDLLFGSHAQLRAIAEVYACDDAPRKFVDDFVAAWVKVMNLDRFDLGPGAAR